jgi:hypothetical protein
VRHHQHPQYQYAKAHQAWVKKICMPPAVDEFFEMQQAHEPHQPERRHNVHGILRGPDKDRASEQVKREKRNKIYDEPGAQIMPPDLPRIFYQFTAKVKCGAKAQQHVDEKDASEKNARIDQENFATELVDELQGGPLPP